MNCANFADPNKSASIFNPKLLLSEEPVTTTNLSIVTETYQIDEPDPHHKNVIHGKILRCCGKEKAFTSRLVSCMEFSNCDEASEMYTHLETLREAVGKLGSVVETDSKAMHIKSNPTSIPLSESVSKSSAVDLKPKGPSTPVRSIQAAPNTSSPKAPAADQLKSGNLQRGSYPVKHKISPLTAPKGASEEAPKDSYEEKNLSNLFR